MEDGLYTLGHSSESRGGPEPDAAWWEVFNAFNRVNWANPNGTLRNRDFGVISSAGAGREMQLSLRYLF